MKRRDALKTLGGLAGMAGMATLLPGCGDDLDNDDGPVGITTYVFLMLENRTYDHVFGGRALEGLGGNGLTAGMTNPDAGGTAVAIYNPTALEMCTQGDPPHGWDAAHAQWNNGANDGFVREHGGRDPMQYLTRDQQPVSWALADAYTTCDRWHAAVMGPTLPNRAYWHTGTSFGLKVNSEILTKFSAGVPVPTIYNRLNEKGVDWAYYFGNLAVVSLLGNPGPYQVELGPNDGTGHVRRFGDAMAMGGQFFKDAKEGKLPSVVYIDPSFYENDDHPPIHPIMGQELIAAVYTALATSPQWKNCMLIVTYDEHGGFYDHVSPPTTTDDTEAKYGVAGFEQMGFRVPAMVVGPYVKKGFISNVLYDHTSALKHIQNTFGLDSINVRIDAANDLSDCIDMERLAAGDWEPPVEIPLVDRSQWPVHDDRCTSDEGGFKIGPQGDHQDPISEWADANPGAFKPEFDLRGQTNGQRMIYDYLAQARAKRSR